MIRAATPDDLAAIVGVKVGALRPVYEPLGSEALKTDYDAAEQRPWLEYLLGEVGDDSPFLVALDRDGQVIAWIRLGTDVDVDDSAAVIYGLFVSPAHQGCGVGRRLVAEGSRIMKSWGCRRLKVQTLSGSPACRFYERIGGHFDGSVPWRDGFEESVYRWPELPIS